MVGEIAAEPVRSEPMIVANTNQDFRACKGTVDMADESTVRIEASVAAALQVKRGDAIRFVTAKPTAADGDAGHDAPESI